MSDYVRHLTLWPTSTDWADWRRTTQCPCLISASELGRMSASFPRVFRPHATRPEYRRNPPPTRCEERISRSLLTHKLILSSRLSYDLLCFRTKGFCRAALHEGKRRAAPCINQDPSLRPPHRDCSHSTLNLAYSTLNVGESFIGTCVRALHPLWTAHDVQRR